MRPTIQNPSVDASYAELLIAYGDRIDATMTFDPATGIDASFQPQHLRHQRHRLVRGHAQAGLPSATETKEALAVRTAEALSNETGVNVDMEMSLLLDLEHAYQASARLIKAVDEMLSALLAAVR